LEKNEISAIPQLEPKTIKHDRFQKASEEELKEQMEPQEQQADQEGNTTPKLSKPMYPVSYLHKFTNWL